VRKVRKMGRKKGESGRKRKMSDKKREKKGYVDGGRKMSKNKIVKK